jgi:hypothetical protein
MRTRNRTLTTTVPDGMYWVDDINNPSNPNYPIQQDTGPQTDWTRIESMTDEKPGMARYGSVDHLVNEVRYFPIDMTYDYWYLDTPVPNPLGGNPRPLYRRKWQGAGMWRMYLGSAPGNTWGNPTISVPSTYDWSTYSYNAVKAMKPTLNKSGLLLLNFISELKEGCYRKGARSQNRGQMLPKGASGYAMGLLRAASRFNLWWQFALKPTLSDVKEIIDRINNLEKNIQRIIREANKIQTRHYTCPIPDRITLPADIVRANVAFSVDQPGWGMREETRWSTEPRYHAVMRFNYDCSAVQGLLGKLRAQLDAYGIDRLISSLWEAIPYSFVVDWFINVGDLLESLESHLKGDLFPVRILDFAHSVKYKYTTRLIHNQGQLGTSHLKVSDILLMERSVTRYIRRREAPCLYARLNVRAPSLNQVLLGGSLIFAR